MINIFDDISSRFCPATCPVHLGETGWKPGEDPSWHQGGATVGRGGKNNLTIVHVNPVLFERMSIITIVAPAVLALTSLQG